MKPITVALLTALAGLTATAARADHSRVSVDVGINVGGPRYGAPVYAAPAPVYVSPAPHYNNHGPARGHWENVTRKTWIPDRWVMTRDRWGRSFRILERGHFAYHTDRVWVEHRGHNRHSGSHSYGWRR